MTSPFVFVHFPKAAGTSLRTQMYAQLGDRLRLDYEHDPLLGAVGLGRAARLPETVTGVHGHFRPHRYLGEIGRVFTTFLRDPIDNIISIYFFWRSYPSVGNPVHDAFIAEQPDIVTFAGHPCMRALMSDTYFGGFDMGRFDFIGFYETRSDDLERLGRILRIDLSADVYVNRTDPKDGDLRATIEASSSIRSELETALHEDIHFYENLRSRRDMGATCA